MTATWSVFVSHTAVPTPAMGAGLDPTGNQMEFVMQLHARPEGAKIAEVWEMFDRVVMNEQLGLG